MACNAISPFKAGLARRPSRLNVVRVNTSGRIHIVETVINSLVDVANGVQACVCSPLIRPNTCAWEYITLYYRYKGGRIALGHELNEKAVGPQLHTPKDPLLWNGTRMNVARLCFGNNGFVDGDGRSRSADLHRIGNHIRRTDFSEEVEPIRHCVPVHTKLHATYVESGLRTRWRDWRMKRNVWSIYRMQKTKVTSVTSNSVSVLLRLIDQ